MSADPSSEVKFDIGHVLFIDTVGYSKLLIADQRELQQQLNQIVRGTEQFPAAEAAGQLVRLPTGAGMALASFANPAAPVQSATELSAASQTNPQHRSRMGIISAPARV